PDLDGDRLEMRDGRVSWESYILAYHNVRVVPDDVRKVWPHLQRGQRPQLRVVDGADPVAAHANVESGQERARPAQERVKLAVQTLWPAGVPSIMAKKERDAKINEWLGANGYSAVSLPIIRSALKS